MKLNDILEETVPPLCEMANLRYPQHGIPRVVMWAGPPPDGQHWLRVKISNVPDTFSEEDNFTITIPHMDIIGNINKQLITGDTLNQIREWIKLNSQPIHDFETKKLQSTKMFLSQLRKI